MSWLCKCGLKNSGLNESGSCAKAFNESIRLHYQVSQNQPDKFQAIVVNIGLYMTEQEELFAKFYSQDKILVKDMDSVQLREHREELAKIAFEAKARLVATDDEVRERHAKSGKGKEWILPVDEHSPVNNDAINTPKIRQARMNKIEKLKSQLKDAGLDDEIIKGMIQNIERKATEKDVKAITFNRPSVEQNIVVVDVKKDSNSSEVSKEPFDPSKLFGKG